MDRIELKDGRFVWLEVTEQDVVRAWADSARRQPIGQIVFKLIEGDGPFEQDFYLVTGLDLDGPDNSRAYLHCGIGREILRRMNDHGGLPIVFSPPDGQQRPDASHLTGDGPAFARQMVDEKLAYWDDYGDENGRFDDLDERD